MINSTKLPPRKFPNYETNINQRMNQIGVLDFESRLKHYRPCTIFDPGLVARTVSSGFNPNSVAGLVAWYEADDPATITKSADRVSQWNDKSAEGNHLVQATGADQPLWVDAVQNGKPIIRFDGVSEYMADLITNTYTQPTTLFIVCSNPTENGGNRAFFDGDSARQLFNLQSVSQYRVFAGTSLIGGTLQSGFKLFRAKFNSTSSSLHINSSSILAGDAGTNSLEGIIIGALNGFTGPANFDVCQILLYDADITGADLTYIENGLTSKWGL